MNNLVIQIKGKRGNFSCPGHSFIIHFLPQTMDDKNLHKTSFYRALFYSFGIVDGAVNFIIAHWFTEKIFVALNLI